MEETHTVHRIPAENLPVLEMKIQALVKRAEKIGCKPVELKISEPIKVEVPVLDPLFPDGEFLRDFDGKPVTKIRVYHDVEVRGETPKFAGWTFVASLTHLAADGQNEAAMILRMVPGEKLPESWRRADQKCDHCGLARRRNETFVVRNEAGTLKQVGRQCIADFLGHQDPEHILSMAEYLFSADGLACGAEDEGWGGSGRRNVFWLSDFVGWVAASIRNYGWLSRSKAREIDKCGCATADRALIAMTAEPKHRKKDHPVPVLEDDELAKKAIEWARGPLAEKPEKGDYEHNLAVVCSRDALHEKGLGIAASVIVAYRRALGIESERKARLERESKSEWFGTPGKREVFELTVLKTIECESAFGRTLLHKFSDQKGNIASWFATAGELEIGKTFKLKATVKAHESYKGVKQTMLTRCSVEDEWYCVACHRVNTPDVAEPKTACVCGVAKGSWTCLNCHKVVAPEAKACDCGHDLKSWRCPKCFAYNVKKAKTCAGKIEGPEAGICGTEKGAWKCHDYQCAKWNGSKVEVCACGRDIKGYQVQAEGRQP